MKNIAIIFGGKSCEHDISIITALQAISHLNKSKYNIYPIYITQTGEWMYTKNAKTPQDFKPLTQGRRVTLHLGEPALYTCGIFPKKLTNLDCSIVCCHGTNGEDGSLQGLLELCNVPYTSSGVSASALTMDKVFMKQVFEVNNFPVTPYYWFTRTEFQTAENRITKEIFRTLESPLIVKPANLGSSIGIQKCSSLDEFKTAVNVALEYDNKVIVEEVVPHLVEVNCAVLGVGNQCELGRLECPQSWQEFLSFEEKYLHFRGVKFADNKKVELSREVKTKIRKIAKTAFQKLDCAGVVRIDFLVNNDTEEVFINEINNIPGALAGYLFPKYTFSQLLDKLIELAFVKHTQKNSCTFIYKSDVLNSTCLNNSKLKTFSGK